MLGLNKLDCQREQVDNFYLDFLNEIKINAYTISTNIYNFELNSVISFTKSEISLLFSKLLLKCL